MGSAFTYRFNTFVLIDHEIGELTREGNLFGLMMEVARKELVFKLKNDEERLRAKKELVRHLLRHKISKSKIQKLLDFIK